MPRRRPSTLRRPAAARRPFWVKPTKDGRLSGSTHAAIILLEDWPSEIHYALNRWEREARTSRPWSQIAYGCGVQGCCGDPLGDRDLLERAIHRLPRRSAQELRRLVRSIDDRILAKFPVQLDYFDRWWHADFPWNYH